jgi:hypothetical protein
MPGKPETLAQARKAGTNPRKHKGAEQNLSLTGRRRRGRLRSEALAKHRAEEPRGAARDEAGGRVHEPGHPPTAPAAAAAAALPRGSGRRCSSGREAVRRGGGWGPLVGRGGGACRRAAPDLPSSAGAGAGVRARVHGAAAAAVEARGGGGGGGAAGEGVGKGQREKRRLGLPVRASREVPRRGPV